VCSSTPTDQRPAMGKKQAFVLSRHVAHHLVMALGKAEVMRPWRKLCGLVGLSSGSHDTQFGFGSNKQSRSAQRHHLLKSVALRDAAGDLAASFPNAPANTGFT
jgi:hypothetical protein